MSNERRRNVGVEQLRKSEPASSVFIVNLYTSVIGGYIIGICQGSQ